MAKKTEIQIFVIAQTIMNRPQIKEWMNCIGAEEFKIPEVGSDVSEAELATGLPAKRCYNSFVPGINPNVTKVRKDWDKYFQNLLEAGHGSVLEHATWTFAIEGCTRVCTAEMNRHRAGVAVSEASLRYIRFNHGEIPYWEPNSIRYLQGDDESLKKKKQLTRELFQKVFEQAENNYKEYCEIWKEELDPQSPFRKKKMVTSTGRRLLPMGISTGVVYTINARALRHIITMRATPEAEEEIAYVGCYLAFMMFKQEPRIFGDFTQTPEGFWVPKNHKV